MSEHPDTVHNPEPRRTKAAGGIVIGPDGRILVVSQHGDSWSLPKGHLDPGEDARTAAIREIEEESGIAKEALELVRELGTYERHWIGKNGQGEDHQELKAITLFLFRTKATALAPKDPDNPEARWVDRTEVASLLTHAKDQEFFADLAASGALDEA
ncbi:MAG TPA: NUDIX domain-containing protein [Candidatus Paceibacterota bacterium]|nr:NUDIX domain-containing protein [Candidatus Paceibacterota bacterium]